MWFWLLIGGSVILVLAVIAMYLHWQLYKQRSEEKKQQEVLQQQAREKLDYINNSIQILAQGVLEDQLSVTEGSIRISVLMSYLTDNEAHKKEFAVFYQVAAKTAHIPILDDWKKLGIKDRLRFDQERAVVEAEYEDFVRDAAKRVLGKRFT